MAYRLGVDVGGTFTDLFLVSEGNGGAQFRVKTPSTPHDPSEGVLTGVRRICEEAGIGVGELQNILHGTTVATNAVLESKGARVGLITTKRPQLEDEDAVLRRIDEVSRFLDIEQLAISTQCGFASGMAGNALDEDAQWRKLELVARIADRVWPRG